MLGWARVFLWARRREGFDMLGNWGCQGPTVSSRVHADQSGVSSARGVVVVVPSARWRPFP